MKIKSDKTFEQNCISQGRNISVNYVNDVIVGTLNIHSLAPKFDE